MPAPASATKHYRRLQRLQIVTISAVRRAWARMEPGGSWETQYRDDVGPKVTALVVAAQIAATRDSDIYVAEVLNELDFGPPTEAGVVLARSIAGYAGDGRPVESLLASSVGRARAIAKVKPPAEALDDSLAFMELVTQSIIADTARAAEEAAMYQRPWVDGFVRMINPPCCSRCAVLSGKIYLFNEGFLRHPRCDCYHLPAPSDPDKVRNLLTINSPERYFESLSEAEQDRIFTQAGADAIREGADISQVVNARRGMAPAQINGRTLLTTTEGTTRRGVARSRMGGLRTRLMPEAIFQIADGDRDEAIRLLRLYGFIT